MKWQEAAGGRGVTGVDRQVSGQRLSCGWRGGPESRETKDQLGQIEHTQNSLEVRTPVSLPSTVDGHTQRQGKRWHYGRPGRNTANQ